MQNPKQPSQTYHHGDLRETLMAAALESIAQDGTEKLSMRALARQAGVSATAPYRHFPSKRCLLAALATRGFRLLEAALREGRNQADSGIEARLVASGLGYLNFARDNQTIYELMFSTVVEDFSEYADLQQASESAYAELLEIMDEVVASRPEDGLSASQLGGVVWSAVHGLASVLRFGRERGETVNERSPMYSLRLLENDPETALRLLLRGVLG